MKKKITLLVLMIFSINFIIAEEVEFKASSVPIFKSMTKTELQKTEVSGENQGDKINKLRNGEKVIKKEETTPIVNVIKKEEKTSQNDIITKEKSNITQENKIKIAKPEVILENTETVDLPIKQEQNKKLPIEIMGVNYQDGEINAISKAKVYITARGNIIYDNKKINPSQEELKYGIKQNIVIFDKKPYTKPQIIKEHIIISGKSFTVQNLVKDKRGAGYEVRFENFFDKNYY